ncbi:MAG: MurR/RpiR family transcriptional regulator [Erysipelotrichaceae bacterium]|nr:MurR/RpiR family transcriptional regulator [Erysipelotrichaceae bacterium]
MEDLNVLEQLKKKEGFTSAESSLADYIIGNVDKVYRMSLQELAKNSYVSKPSVIRLYRKIGCKSYRDFSIALQLEKIRTDGSSVIESGDAFTGSKSMREFAEIIGLLSKQIIDNCIMAINNEELDDIIHVLDEANRIFVYASGDIETEVRSFNNRMSMMSVEPIMINDDADQQKLIASIQEDDVVIIVSSLADNETYDKTIEFIYETNALKILITTYEDPNKRFQPDYAFYTYPNGNEFIRNSVSISQMSLLLGMNIIQTCLLKLRSEKRG